MGVGPIEGPPYAAVVIARMLKRYPTVRFAVREEIFGTLRASLLNGDIDFIVGPSPDDAGPGLLNEIIAHRRETRVVVRASHRLAKKRHVTLKDLARSEWVLPAFSTPTYRSFAEIFARDNLSAPTGPVTAPGSSKTTLALVLTTDLVGLLPADVVHSELQQGVLKQLPFAGALFTPPVSIITRDPLALPAICNETLNEIRHIGAGSSA